MKNLEEVELGLGLSGQGNWLKEELSIDTVKRMKSFLARHEGNLQTDANSDPDDPGYPGAGLISFYLWGGYPERMV